MKVARIPSSWSIAPVFTATCLGVVLSLCESRAQSNIVIVGPTLGGAISWTAPPQVATFNVEWAPSITGPWTNSWAGLVGIFNTGNVCTAQLPVFYRVVGYPYSGVLLHGDGANGSTVITDARGHAVHVFGDAQICTTNLHVGTGSIFFDGAGDYLNLGTNADWAFGTGDFTVDFWASFSRASGTMHLIGLHTSGLYTEWSLIYQGTVLNVYVSGVVAAGYTWTPVLGQWYHLALTRSGGALRLFVDGKLVKTAANTVNLLNGRDLTIGAAANPSLYFYGFLDEVHVLKGQAMWTEDFTPPTKPYDF